VCIYNPVSGEGAGGSKINEVREILLASSREVRLAPTEAPNHASALAHEAAATGADLIVVQGGDGTVNEAVQGVAGTDSVALLVLPGGTANVLAKEVGLPADPVGAACLLPRLEARTVRLGLVELADGGSRYFLLMCGAGLDAEIAARTLTPLKHRLGLGAFWLQGAEQALRRFPRLFVDDGGPVKGSGACSLVVISKSRNYGGGLIFTPGANLLANRFQVARFSGTNRFLYCGYLLAGVCALTSRWPGIRHETCSELKLAAGDSSPVRLQVDGEVAGKLPAKVSLSSASLSLLLPPEYGMATGKQLVSD
jgi:diacylglycerol kinase family enzyme